MCLKCPMSKQCMMIAGVLGVVCAMYIHFIHFFTFVLKVAFMFVFGCDVRH